ncbi:MAG: dienelactone hydrolase family protein [Gemmatimonadetes bacterium]|nr:dienelactone hydrolase family protein [Gemmatimonadota bacterium]
MEIRKKRHGVLAAGFVALIAGVWACGGEDARADSSSAGDDVTAESAQESDIPDAILGKAPAPRGEDLAYFDADPSTVGYIVAPEGDGPFPAVILIHEWNGLVDRVRQVADALADEGYVALAADMYSSRIGTNRDENMTLMQEAQADPDRVIANLDAAASYLRGRDDVTGKVAAMGWCFGGGVALSFALGGESHEGTAIFYGRLIEDPEVLASIDHPVYGTFAELDGGIPPDQVNRFAGALREAGVENDIHIYDDVNHGFWLWVDRDPETAAAPAADAWVRLKSYLSRVIG